jgi:hypothetical protein
MSYFDLAVTFGMAGINLLFKIVEAIVFIFPTLVNQFCIPVPRLPTASSGKRRYRSS